MKLLDTEHLSDTLRLEFQRLKGLYHPHLARVHDLGVEQGSDGPLHYYVADLIEGVPLSDVMTDPEAALAAIADSLEALSFLHSLGIRHGDYKPANVVVDGRGRGVLIDLGCAGIIGTAPERISGTPGYIAPELLEGGVGDARSDVYAVGRVLSELGETWGSGGKAPVDEKAVSRVARRATEREPRRRPGTIREVLEALGRHAPSFGPPEGRSPELLGRASQMAIFEAALDSLLAARPGRRALTLVGPPGVGKSRLLREMKWKAQLACRVIGGDPDEKDTVGGMLARAGTQPRPKSLEAILDAGARLARGPSPIVLVLDELDHCDTDQRTAMEALLRVQDATGAVLVITATTVAVSGVEPLIVEPLSLPAVIRWAALRSLSAEQATALFRWSGGYPADVEAVLSRLSSGEIAESELESVARGVKSDGALADVTLGAEEERRVVALVIARGGMIDLSEATELRLDPHALVALQTRRILVRDEAALRLARPSETSALRRAVGEAGIAAAHAELVTHFEGRADDGGDGARSQAAAEVVVHLSGAGRRDAATRHFLAHRASHAIAPDAWKRAAEALGVDARTDEPALVLVAADVLADRGALSAALSLLMRLLRSRPEPRSLARCRASIGSILLRRGDARRAARQLELAMGSLIDAERGRAQDLLARALIQRARYAAAEEHARAGLAQEGLDAALRGALHESVGVASMYLGRIDEARAELDAALAALPTASPPRTRVRVLSYRGIVEFRAGDLDAAIHHYRRAMEIAESHGLADQLRATATNLATALQQRGDWGGALTLYERALRLAVALDSSELTVRLNLANIWAQIGLFDRARDAAARVITLAEREGRTNIELTCVGILADSALAQKDAAGARDHYGRALEGFVGIGAEREAAEMRLGLFGAHLLEGDAEAIARARDDAEGAVRAVDAEDLTIRFDHLRARERAAEGDEGRALELLEASAKRAEAIGERLLAAEIAATAAQVARRMGAQELAAGHARRARMGYDRIGVSLPAELREAFWSHPAREGLATTVEPTLHRGTALPAERLLQINKRLNSSLSTERVLAHAIDAAIELTRAERGFILLNSDGTDLEVAVARNLDRERIGRSHLKFSRSIAVDAIETGEPLLTTDARGDARFRDNASVHAMRLTSVMCAPIRSPRGVLGAIYLDNRFERGRFSEMDLATLLACADQVAIALDNARLHSDLEKRTAELEREKARVDELLREREAEIVRLETETRNQREALTQRYGYSQIIGRGPAMREVLTTLDRVIPSPLSVLVQGESGTGKELIAKAIHFEGPRRDAPFVAVNCAALPDTLLEGELFGWVKGAFTGADRDREGLFARGRGGTLFLDEIGETSPAMQAKLLRALQEGEIFPLGSTEKVDLDVRVVAATNRVLSDEVAAGRFREDLYYRLAVVEVNVPPLRDRSEDLVPIASALLERLCADLGVAVGELHPDATRVLLRHTWPGNVRELENVLSRAVVMSEGEVIREDHLGLQPLPVPARSRAEFEDGEKERIERELASTGWNVSEVSRRLGIPRNTLYRRLKRYGLSR